MDAVRIQSKFIVVSPTRCLHPGQLVVRRGRVVELTDNVSQPADLDLGEAVLLPGLINAHTHLEFSALQQPFPAGHNFPQWVSQVVAYRRSLMESAAGQADSGPLETLRTTIRAGLLECFLSGTVLVGDIVTPPWQANLLPSPRALLAGLHHPGSQGATRHGNFSEADWQVHLGPLCFPRVLALTELLGLSAERLNISWQWAREFTTDATSELLLGHGLSPHAPYSIHFPSIQRVLAETQPTTLLAMHVAESPAELEWVTAEMGPFGEVFRRMGITLEAPPPSIAQCIDLLSRQQRALLVHGNYLTRSQMRQVALAPGITVVYCPRTHAHFGHDRYPLSEMLKAGIKIVLGTDSRASNPDLSLWDEVVQVKQLYPELAGSELLEWVTATPARALGVERDFGSLELGRLAHACAARARDHWTPDNLLEEMSQQSAAELVLTPLSCITWC